METPITILATKTLADNQRKAFIEAGIDLFEEDFIISQKIEFELKDTHESLIFTSQNAVLSLLEHPDLDKIKTKKTYCVGVKTKTILTENGFEVVAYADYASELAEIISLVYNTEKFTFLSGNLRKEDLPRILKESNVVFNEIKVYETELTPCKIKEKLDAILFFSPSGVNSYLKNNKIKHELCFCIGNTTAEALIGITKKIILPEMPDIDLMVEMVIENYKEDSF
jgi:uroporphyrinogen-III synthase